MTRTDRTAALADTAFDKGVAHANARRLFTAVRCFVDAHQYGHPIAARYLRALRPYCDDLTFGMVAADIIRR